MFGQVKVETAEEAQKVENRSEYRRRVLKSGNLMFNKGYASYGCRVRNISENGVLVEMESTGGLPSEFDFRMKDEIKKRPVKIVWREPTRMGLQFIN